jgi:hypothetical protein
MMFAATAREGGHVVNVIIGRNGEARMKRLLKRIGKIVSRVICPQLFIVASRPFRDDDKWKILYGSRLSYRVLEFRSLDAANREFESIKSFAAYRFGETVYDFLLLDATQTQRVVEGESFVAVVDQALSSRSNERRGPSEPDFELI